MTLGSSGSQWSNVSHGVVNNPVSRFALRNWQKGETVSCLIIVAIFTRLRGAYRLGGDFGDHFLWGRLTH